MERNEVLEMRIEKLEQQLDQQAEKNRHLTVDWLVMDLLRSGDSNGSRAVSELLRLGHRPKGNRFAVLQLVLQERDGAQAASLQELISAYALARSFLDSAALDGDLLLHTHDLGSCYCVVCAGPQHKDLAADLERWAETLLEQIESICFLTMQAGVSAVVESLEDVPKAYRTLEMIQDYRRFLLDETPCLVFQRIENRFTDTGGKRAPEKHLFHALRTHNYQETRSYLEDFFREIFVDSRPGITDLTSQFYRLVNPMLDTISEVMADISAHSPEWDQLNRCRERLLHVSCLAQLQEESAHAINLLESVYLRKQSGAEPRWMEQLLTTIDQEFRDPQISVGALAERIGITSVHMSRVFRQLRGMGVMDYVHQRRIAVAKQLLSRGESVKSVCTQVGYASQLTMTRAFKKYDGNTPGYYVRSHYCPVNNMSS